MEYRSHIDGLRHGSYEDFAFLYEKFSGSLYGFVFDMLKSESLSKEIVQETFIKIWTGREKINPDLSFKAYLFKISKNKIIDQFRRQIANPVFESYLDHCENIRLQEGEVEQKLDFDMFMKRLQVAKSKLTARQREIFELSKEFGLSSSEIATRLNINDQTVYNQLSAAMRILKQEMMPHYILMFIIFFGS